MTSARTGAGIGASESTEWERGSGRRKQTKEPSSRSMLKGERVGDEKEAGGFKLCSGVILQSGTVPLKGFNKAGQWLDKSSSKRSLDSRERENKRETLEATVGTQLGDDDGLHRSSRVIGEKWIQKGM